MPPEGLSGIPIDCHFFGETNNCWAETAHRAASCTDPSLSGVISADRESCVYPDGSMALFDPPLPAEFVAGERADDQEVIIFDALGAPCSHLVSTGEGEMQLIGDIGVFTVELVGFSGLQYECPDRTQYYIEDALEAFEECGADGGLPGWEIRGHGNGFVLGLLNDLDSDDALLDCREDPQGGNR